MRSGRAGRCAIAVAIWRAIGSGMRSSLIGLPSGRMTSSFAGSSSSGSARMRARTIGSGARPVNGAGSSLVAWMSPKPRRGCVGRSACARSCGLTCSPRRRRSRCSSTIARPVADVTMRRAARARTPCARRRGENLARERESWNLAESPSGRCRRRVFERAAARHLRTARRFLDARTGGALRDAEVPRICARVAGRRFAADAAVNASRARGSRARSRSCARRRGDGALRNG